MATKQLSRFGDYRAAARTTRPPRLSGNNSNDSDDPLMLAVEGSTEMSAMGSDASARRLANVRVPDWLKRIKPIETALDDILHALGELDKLQSKKLHNLAFTSASDDEKISVEVKTLTRRMRDVKDSIKKLGSGTEMSPQVTYMKDNIQKVLASRLQDVGNRFRRDQLRYQSELESTTKPKPPGPLVSGVGTSATFSTGDRPVQLDDDDEDDGEVHNYDIGFTDQQQARADTNRIRINQRMQEIRDIAQQVEELGAMFNDIATMVHEQGSLLDRIDYNIESADHSITQGNKEIEEVVKGEKGFSKRLCFLTLLILIFGVVVIIVIMTK